MHMVLSAMCLVRRGTVTTLFFFRNLISIRPFTIPSNGDGYSVFGFNMLASLILYAVLLLPAVWGFGLTESGNSYIVDTEGGLIFTGEYFCV